MWRLQLPIWREVRGALEGVDLYRRRAELGHEVPRGDGGPVLLIPGYLSGDRALVPLAGWLRQLGYAPEHADIAANVDCVTRTTERLVERLVTITEAHGDRAVVVGHSLGGVLGRLLAVRRPDLVRGVVCLGSPLVSFDAVHPLVWAHVRLLGTLGGLGIPGLLSHDCLRGRCCAESRQLVRAELPNGVRFLSVYSRSDGIVHWRACLDPWAEHVEVDSSHLGMPVNAAVYRVLADHLARFGEQAPPETMRAAA
jgi:triacylglycerol lipase